MITLTPIPVSYRRAAAVLIAVTALAVDAFAQSTSLRPGQFGVPFDQTDFTATELHANPSLPFVELPDGAPADLIKGILPRELGPFAASYPFARVRIYLSRDTPADQRGGIGDDATVRLLAATDDHQGGRRWWQIETGRNAYFNNLVRISEEPGTDESIEAAVDPALPLVRVRYEWTAVGANTTGQFEIQLLIDFRRARPSVVAASEAWMSEGGGACGAYDSQYTIRARSACEWQIARGDFLCTTRATRADTIWAPRTMARQFWLSTGEPPQAPLQPADAARRLWAHTGDQALALAGFGRVFPLIRGTLQNGAAYRLFAIPGTGPELDARIIAIVAAPNQPPQFVSLERSGRIPQPTEYPRGAAANLVAEQDAQISATLVAQQSDAAVFRVVLREGKFASVYVAGLSHSAGAARLDSLFLATNGEQYDACARSRLPESAIAATITPQPFSIAVDVEPAHHKDVNDETSTTDRAVFDAEEQPPCGWTGAVTWDITRGFEIRDQRTHCMPGAREVLINEQGVIGSRAAYRRAFGVDRGEQTDALVMGQSDTAFLLLPDPDFRAAIWESVVERLSSTHLVIAANVVNPFSYAADPMTDIPAQIDKIVAEYPRRRWFVVAHWLSAGYATKWAQLHPEMVAGILVHHPESEVYGYSARLHAWTGTAADRLAYARTIDAKAAEIIAANMRVASVNPTRLRLLADSMDWREPAEGATQPPMWVVGIETYGARHINGPARFGMVQDPSAFTTFLLDLLKKSVR